MKSLLLGATILSSVAMFSAIASAADAVVYEEPAVVDVAASLTGFYAGLAVGYQWGDYDASGVEADEVDDILDDIGIGKNEDGGTGGVYAGYNWQVSDRWLVGAEADINYIAAGKGDNWVGSARLRGGYIFNGDTLLYGTGGVAFGDVDSDIFVGLVQGAPAGFSVDTGAAVGWTIGAGVEHWFTDKVSFKMEYLYTDLGDVNSLSQDGFGEIIALDWTSHTARAGIALHF